MLSDVRSPNKHAIYPLLRSAFLGSYLPLDSWVARSVEWKRRRTVLSILLFISLNDNFFLWCSYPLFITTLINSINYLFFPLGLQNWSLALAETLLLDAYPSLFPFCLIWDLGFCSFHLWVRPFYSFRRKYWACLGSHARSN